MSLLGDIKVDGTIIKETFNGVSSLLSTIREVITGEASPEKKLEALNKLNDLEQQLKVGQIEINKIEAGHTSILVAGWRPAIGWVCAASLASYYIPQALIAAALWAIQCIAVMKAAVDITKVTLPAYPLIFNVEEILGLVASLLGLAVTRSWDKKTLNGGK